MTRAHRNGSCILKDTCFWERVQCWIEAVDRGEHLIKEEILNTMTTWYVERCG